jgi:hypothetical protein
MHRWRMLFVGLCTFVFTVGCRGACDSHNDYTGPLPYEPSDFLFRKNSILGGDPAMSARIAEGLSDTPTNPEAETSGEEAGPEDVPTPAPGFGLDDDLDGNLDSGDLEGSGLDGEPGGDMDSEPGAGLDDSLDGGLDDQTAGDLDADASSAGWKPVSSRK